MSRLNALRLIFPECAGLDGEDDVVATVHALQPLGLTLAGGAPWTFDGHPSPLPAAEVGQQLAKFHLGWQQIWRNAKERPRDPLKHTDRWGSGLLRVDQPHTFATIDVTRWGWDRWDVSINITADRLKQAGLTAEEFAESWEELVEQLGDILYGRLRPSIGLLYATARDIPDFGKPVLARKFGFGWRTWYGPAYVNRYGHDWLRGMPDRTRDLPDGGVSHALHRPLADLVLGARDVYETVWPYLDQADINPFWPNRRRVPARASVMNRVAKSTAVRPTNDKASALELSADARMHLNAAEAVDLAHQRFHVELDYSEESVERVEQILDRIHRESIGESVGGHIDDGARKEELWALSLAFGSYVGEVLRLRWGGEWRPNDDETGAEFSLQVGRVKAFPVHKVHKRLVDGEEDHVWAFYQRVRAYVIQGKFTSGISVQ